MSENAVHIWLKYAWPFAALALPCCARPPTGPSKSGHTRLLSDCWWTDQKVSIPFLLWVLNTHLQANLPISAEGHRCWCDIVWPLEQCLFFLFFSSRWEHIVKSLPHWKLDQVYPQLISWLSPRWDLVDQCDVRHSVWSHLVFHCQPHWCAEGMWSCINGGCSWSCLLFLKRQSRSERYTQPLQWKTQHCCFTQISGNPIFVTYKLKFLFIGIFHDPRAMVNV